MVWKLSSLNWNCIKIQFDYGTFIFSFINKFQFQISVFRATHPGPRESHGIIQQRLTDLRFTSEKLPLWTCTVGMGLSLKEAVMQQSGYNVKHQRRTSFTAYFVLEKWCARVHVAPLLHLKICCKGNSYSSLVFCCGLDLPPPWDSTPRLHFCKRSFTEVKLKSVNLISITLQFSQGSRCVTQKTEFWNWTENEGSQTEC